MSYTAHEVALNAITTAIVGTSPLTGVPNQRVVTSHGGEAAAPLGYWMTVPLTQESMDDQLDWRRIRFIVEMRALFPVACGSPQEWGRVTRDAAAVAHAISRCHALNLSGSDGRPCLYQPKSQSFSLDATGKTIFCSFEVHIEIELMR